MHAETHEAGCDFAQGYLYAKPRPGAEVPKTIQDWPLRQIHGAAGADKSRYARNLR